MNNDRPYIQNIDEVVVEGDELCIDERSNPLTVTGMHTRTPFEETPESYIDALNTIELKGNGTTYHLKTSHTELKTRPVLYTASEWKETTGEDDGGYPYTYIGDGEAVSSIQFETRDLRRVPRNADMLIDVGEYTLDGVCVGKEVVDDVTYSQGSVSLVFEGDWWEDVRDMVDSEVLTVDQTLERRTEKPGVIAVRGSVFEDTESGTVEEHVSIGSALSVTVSISAD